MWHPIPPICLDDKRLLGEHVEIHSIWNIITQNKKGYENRPEVNRWRGHLPALFHRHRMITMQMIGRGMKPKSPLLYHGMPRIKTIEMIDTNKVVWPETIEPIEDMRAKLAAKIYKSL